MHIRYSALSVPQILSEGWCCFCLKLWWAVVSRLLEESFGNTGFSLTTLILTKALVYILNGGATTLLVVAVLAKTLFDWGHIYRILLGSLIALARSGLRIVAQSISIWTSGCLVQIRVVLLEHLAWAALILLKCWMTMMLLKLLLATSALLFSVFRTTNSARYLTEWACSVAIWPLLWSTSSSHLIRDHHNPWAFIANDAAIVHILEVQVLTWAVATQIAVSLLACLWIPLFWAAELLVHLHQLHNWLRELDVFASREVSGFSGALAITAAVGKSKWWTLLFHFFL